MLADVLPRHSFTASGVWTWLVELLAGLSVKAAAEKARLPFALEAVYRLFRKLRGRLDALRSRLSREHPPPASTRTEPLLHTLDHLRVVFARTECPLAHFQLFFQQPFLG